MRPTRPWLYPLDVARLGLVGGVVLLWGCATNDLLPSNLRTVAASGTVCEAGAFPGKAFDNSQRSDGTQHTFSVPTGQVLVITAVELSGSGGVAGHSGALVVTAISSTPLVYSVLFGQPSITLDSGGNMTRQHTFPTGVVVKSGVTLCASAVDETAQTVLTVFGLLHGYLAPDK